MSAPHDSLQLDVEDVENGHQRSENAKLESGLEFSTLSTCSHQMETIPLQLGKVSPKLGHFVMVRYNFTGRIVV